MYCLGIDLGSSSIKLSILDAKTGLGIASCHYPETEMVINCPHPGWAEQDPDTWWENIKLGCRKLFAGTKVSPSQIQAIGISYQMHGLVLVDKNQQILRPAIIWCDSRAVEEGESAFEALGESYCHEHLLNSPGNFTASKLRWVQQNEPEIFERIDKFMLPGDFIAMKLSNEVTTTACGLSEATLWDFKEQGIATALLDHWGMSVNLIPALVPAIGNQCQMSSSAAKALGFSAGIPISYRAGDQSNNAFSLNVLEPGEVAATAGTSGVIYTVSNKLVADEFSRVNTFLHVSETASNAHKGMLLCVNGTGRSYSWLRQLLCINNTSLTYSELNDLAEQAPCGSDGLLFLPFGNGAERLIHNRMPGAAFRQLDFNRHTAGHMVRAVQEGIIFALKMGFDVFTTLSGDIKVVRASRSNLFSSNLFAEIFANVMQTELQLFSTDGAEGAARGAALGCGYFKDRAEAFNGLTLLQTIVPDKVLQQDYKVAYKKWTEQFSDELGS